LHGSRYCVSYEHRKANCCSSSSRS
jgi:hypothetical protein